MPMVTLSKRPNILCISVTLGMVSKRGCSRLVNMRILPTYQRQSEAHRTKWAATYLTGKAATWWRGQVVQHGHANVDGITWDQFHEGMIVRFVTLFSDTAHVLLLFY